MKRFQGLFRSWATKAPPKRVREPRQFPTTGFDRIDPSDKVEEEKLPTYNKDAYYPVRMGEVFRDRYQVVAKLGYGTTSTVWLCRDLAKKKDKFWALKVYTNKETNIHELEVFKVIKAAASRSWHPGKRNVRQLEDTFKVAGPKGEHHVSVMKPMGMSLRTFQGIQDSKALGFDFAVVSIQSIIPAIDFLHEEADIVHTDLHSDNVMIPTKRDSVLASFEDDQMKTPSARKIADDGRETHVTKYGIDGFGPPCIGDFGQARVGEPHTGPAMPIPYRAPEVILKMPWGKAIDKWSMGLLIWEMLESKPLFDLYDAENPELNDAHHLAAMTVVKGPPPKEFLDMSEETKKYWDDEGEWIGPVPLPDLKHISQQVTRFDGQDCSIFINYINSFMRWVPEDRMSGDKAFMHTFLRQVLPRKYKEQEEKASSK